jgi:hypothetical protein
MKAQDVTATLDLALFASGLDKMTVVHRPRLLSDNGASYVAEDLIAKMSELRRKGIPRSDLKVLASDPDQAAITRDIEALNDA